VAGNRRTPVSPRVATDPQPYWRLLEKHPPDLAKLPARPIDTGWACFLFDIDREWIARFPRDRAMSRAVEVEVKLLSDLEQRLRIPVPHCEHVVRDGDGRILFVVYRKLQGMPLPSRGLTGPEADAWERQLAELLASLARFRRERAMELGITWADRGDTLGRWEWLYPRVRRYVHPKLSVRVRERDREYWDAYIEGERKAQRCPVLNHGDLAPEHILVQGPRVTGILDWESACFEDMAALPTGLPRANGFMARVATRYLHESDPDLFRRIAFRWHASPAYSVLYGLSTRDPTRVRRALELYRRTLPPC
jgi:aminoglycoside phosphotransferase (APT) family kinase protein